MSYNNINHYSKSFSLGIILNTLFVVVELIYGFRSNSIALLADATHKASDVIGLCLVWFSYYVAHWKVHPKFTFGFKRATIASACINSGLLFFAIGNLLWESVQRLITPEAVIPSIVIWISMLGVLVNCTSALLFLKQKNSDLNIRTAFLNMALDTLISLAVVIGGVFIWWQNWLWLDPLLGIGIALAIILSIWQLFKESCVLLLHGIPNKVSLHAVIADIQNVDAINSYHSLHIWAISTQETALSVHITTTREAFDHDIIHQLTEVLTANHQIDYTTIQLEVDDKPNCHRH